MTGTKPPGPPEVRGQAPPPEAPPIQIWARGAGLDLLYSLLHKVVQRLLDGALSLVEEDLEEGQRSEVRGHVKGGLVPDVGQRGAPNRTATWRGRQKKKTTPHDNLPPPPGGLAGSPLALKLIEPLCLLFNRKWSPQEPRPHSLPALAPGSGCSDWLLVSEASQ